MRPLEIAIMVDICPQGIVIMKLPGRAEQTCESKMAAGRPPLLRPLRNNRNSIEQGYLLRKAQKR